MPVRASQHTSISLTLLVFGLAICCLLNAAESRAQSDSSSTPTQTIRGTVFSSQTHLPLPRGKVIIVGTKLGALSSKKGEYHIEKVPIGDYRIRASAVGYGLKEEEIVVTSGHQIVVDFSLEEKVIQGDTVNIGGEEALATINRVAAVSTTPFNVIDVERYAGGFDDPSRMAENFAGVSGHGTTNNYLVVRGGSPIELLWQLDGIDILNPNQLGKAGTSGGLISTINPFMLGNSDFLAGAFPAEYGTKLSAVFDLHTRNGNTENFEGMAQVDFTGITTLAEGPIPGLTGSSVLVSYRHSTLSWLNDLGLLHYGQLPDFDDAMAKIHLALGQYDQVNMTGLWSSSSNADNESAYDELSAGSGSLIGGIDWQHIYSDELVSHVMINHAQNTYNENGNNYEFDGTTEIAYNTAKAILSYTPSASQSFEVGIRGQFGAFTLPITIPYLNAVVDTGFHSNFYTAYLNWNWSIFPELVLNSGLFSQWITYNTSNSLEPRVSLAWSPAQEHTFALAFGVIRQPEPLNFAEAVHYVAGYTFRPDPNLLIKLEGYLKNYSDVPIHASTLDSYSFMNVGDAESVNFNDLTNKGVGKTYGAELTILKHYESGYFITATASLVRQEFAGSDGIWHFGAFDNEYILNLLAGYDIKLTSSSYLTLSEKCTLEGGGMYTPFNIPVSEYEGYGVLDSAHAYSARNPPYVRLDLGIEFHFNWRSTAFTLYLSALNALNTQNVLDRFYESSKSGQGGYGSIQYDYDVPRLPVLGLRYEF